MDNNFRGPQFGHTDLDDMTQTLKYEGAGGYGAPTVEKLPVSMQGNGMSGLQYQVLGTLFQALTINFTAPQQTIYSQQGGMSWMTQHIQMNTTTGGGIGKMLGRMFSGGGLFIVDFNSPGGPGSVTFSSEVPGKIVPILLNQGQSIILQKDAFLVAEKTVDLDIFFNRKLGAGFFGGEGFILQQFTGPGLCFAQFDGEIVEYTLQAGETLRVDTGHVAMFEPTITFDIQMMRGFKNILFGGEGLFLGTLTGPGRVWLQSMPVQNLAAAVGKYINTGGGGGGVSIGGIRLGE